MRHSSIWLGRVIGPALAGVCALLLPLVAAAQTPPPKPVPQVQAQQVAPEERPVPTGVIRGQITSHPDGRPLSRARVILQRPDRDYAWVTITDEDGRYEIEELEGSPEYMLSANALTIRLAEGEHLTQDLRVRRAPTGAAGRPSAR